MGLVTTGWLSLCHRYHPYLCDTALQFHHGVAVRFARLSIPEFRLCGILTRTLVDPIGSLPYHPA